MERSPLYNAVSSCIFDHHGSGSDGALGKSRFAGQQQDKKDRHLGNFHSISLGLPTSHDAKKLGPSTSSSIPRTLQRTGTNHRSSGERGAGNGITRLGSSVQTMKSLPIPQLFPLSNLPCLPLSFTSLSLSLSLSFLSLAFLTHHL